MRTLTAAILLSALSSLFGGTVHRKTEEGNRLYRDGAYEDALRAYTEGLAEAPDRPELQYDLGNTLYRKGDFSGAADAYSRALGPKAPSLDGAAAYNLGNALFRQERYEDAVRQYRRALKADPTDADARRNLELALRALQARPQPEQRNDSQDRGDDRKKPQPSPSPAPSPSSSPNPENATNGDDRKQDEKSGGQSESRHRPGDLSPDDAKRLLDRLVEMERDQLRRERGRARVEEPVTEKDW